MIFNNGVTIISETHISVNKNNNIMLSNIHAHIVNLLIT